MAEVTAMADELEPCETLFVADAMTGQDAVKSAAEFAGALPLTGVVLTKLDGDTRGGAALSIRSVAEVPIRFVDRERGDSTLTLGILLKGYLTVLKLRLLALLGRL